PRKRIFRRSAPHGRLALAWGSAARQSRSSADEFSKTPPPRGREGTAFFSACVIRNFILFFRLSDKIHLTSSQTTHSSFPTEAHSVAGREASSIPFERHSR